MFPDSLTIPGPRTGKRVLQFHRSSFCGANGCVEVAALPGEDVALRDSKDDRPNAPVLRFTADEWDAFVAGVLDGQFTRDALHSHAADG